MKRIDRSLALFSLSALDALACATGVFVLIVVVLMPYYRNSFDQKAAIEGLRMAASEAAAELNDTQARLGEETDKAAAALAALQKITTQAAAMQKQAATPPRPTPKPTGDVAVVELDLVFAIDTTASMEPVLQELARSMASIVRILERIAPSVRIGVVAYRDRDSEPPVILSLPLTSTQHELERVLDFVRNLRVSRIGSYPLQEELRQGLYMAMAMPLRPSARQAIVVIGDAAAHIEVQAETLERTRSFVAGSDRRTVSALFVTTPSSLSIGNADRAFFVQLAQAGRGAFTDHVGSMIESILLSILAE